MIVYTCERYNVHIVWGVVLPREKEGEAEGRLVAFFRFSYRFNVTYIV